MIDAPAPRRGRLFADESLSDRALAFLYGAGALLFLAVLLPHDPTMDVARILLIGAGAGAVAVGIIMGPHLSPAAQNVAVAMGTLLITLAIDAAGSTNTGFAFMYVWVMLYAAVFLSPRAAGLHLGFVAACFGALLILHPTESAATDWIILTGTLAAASTVIFRVRAFAEKVLEELADAARSDPLTGAANRRAFHEGFAVELERARRTGEPLALLLCDIDHFKRVNDTRGHDEGDEVLKAVVDALRERRRTGDLVARLGGEEFALVLPGTDLAGGVAAADRARRAVRDATAARGLAVTMSVGLAIHPPAGADAASLLRAADGALYSAKERGRDRCTAAAAEDLPSVPASRTSTIPVARQPVRPTAG